MTGPGLTGEVDKARAPHRAHETAPSTPGCRGAAVGGSEGLGHTLLRVVVGECVPDPAQRLRCRKGVVKREPAALHRPG